MDSRLIYSILLILVFAAIYGLWIRRRGAPSEKRNGERENGMSDLQSLGKKTGEGRPISRPEIEAGLLALAQLPVPGDLSKGAMCYSVVKEKGKDFLLCPRCGAKSWFPSGIVGIIERAAKLVLGFRSLGAKIDLSSCCLRCSPEFDSGKEISFRLAFRFDEEAEEQRVLATYQDLKILKEFLAGKNRTAKAFGVEVGLQEWAPRLSALLLGHPRDWEGTADERSSLESTLSRSGKIKTSFRECPSLPEIGPPVEPGFGKTGDEWLAIFEEDYRKAPRDPYPVLKYANLLVQLNHFEKAAKIYEHLASLEPDCQDFRYQFGNVLHHLGRSEEACRQWEVILDLADPETIWEKKAREKIAMVRNSAP